MEETIVGTTALKAMIQSTGSSPNIYVEGGNVEAVLIVDGKKIVCEFNARNVENARRILGID